MSRKLLHVCEPGDIVQDASLVALHRGAVSWACQTIDPDCWFRSVVLGTVCSQARRNLASKRNPAVACADRGPLVFLSEVRGEIPDRRAPTPLDVQLSRERAETIFLAIAGLDRVLSEVVFLVDVHGCKVGELAARMGIPAQRISRILHEARSQLREELTRLKVRPNVLWRPHLER